MSEEQKDNPIHTIASGLAEFFHNDPRKIVYWLFTKNMNFGGCTPAELMARDGRPERVAQFIIAAQEMNQAPTPPTEG